MRTYVIRVRVFVCNVLCIVRLSLAVYIVLAHLWPNHCRRRIVGWSDCAYAVRFTTSDEMMVINMQSTWRNHATYTHTQTRTYDTPVEPVNRLHISHICTIFRAHGLHVPYPQATIFHMQTQTAVGRWRQAEGNWKRAADTAFFVLKTTERKEREGATSPRRVFRALHTIRNQPALLAPMPCQRLYTNKTFVCRKSNRRNPNGIAQTKSKSWLVRSLADNNKNILGVLPMVYVPRWFRLNVGQSCIFWFTFCVSTLASCCVRLCLAEHWCDTTVFAQDHKLLLSSSDIAIRLSGAI